MSDICLIATMRYKGRLVAVPSIILNNVFNIIFNVFKRKLPRLLMRYFDRLTKAGVMQK